MATATKTKPKAKKKIPVKLAQAGGTKTVSVEPGRTIKQILAQADAKVDGRTATLKVGKKKANMSTKITRPCTIVVTPKIDDGI